MSIEEAERIAATLALIALGTSPILILLVYTLFA